jgi:outer membrane protein OmpA-like peptidoglycan-associated protein
MYQPIQHNKRYLLSIFWMTCLTPALWAFDPAVYMQIRQCFSNGEVEVGIEKTEKQIKKEKNEAQWYWLLDDVYQAQNHTQARIECLERALAVKKLTEKEATTLRLAQAYFDAGRYNDARAIYVAFPPSKARNKWLRKCAVADSLRNHPVDVTWTSMGDSINLPYDNIWPGITTNGKWFYSTVVWGKRGFVGNTLLLQENIYISEKKEGVWQPARPLPAPINTRNNEGAARLSADGNYLFFVRCGEQGGMGSCDIYYCFKKDGKWSQPILAGAPLNSRHWESTPCLSASGKEMYFATNRPDGMGKKDIWVCQVNQLDNQQLVFSNAQALPAPINTAGDEIAPFLHANDSTLYFSSNGHDGMGQLDIFYSNRGGTGAWDMPRNMGYPINTHQDEMGWTVSPDGSTAYLSADSCRQGLSHKIVYRIDLPIALRPRSMNTEQAMQIEASYTLPNIYFDFDKATLQAASYAELDQLVAYMQTMPDKRFTIVGHTDNQGNETYNQTLSEQRAQSVMDYLIQQGIAPNRLQSKGMGSAQPIESNTTEWGRTQNRRIEVRMQ